jgi:hypothetical protein
MWYFLHIQDSASWHEMGEEIGIFLTPKAMLMINSIDLDSAELAIGDINILDIVTSGEPKLKVNTFKTNMVDWYNGKEYFNRIISKYPTILPEIHNKILFSSSRLDFFEKSYLEMDGFKEYDDRPDPKLVIMGTPPMNQVI